MSRVKIEFHEATGEYVVRDSMGGNELCSTRDKNVADLIKRSADKLPVPDWQKREVSNEVRDS